MFCPNCGRERTKGKFCSGCGYNFEGNSQTAHQEPAYSQKNIIEVLSEKIKISVIIWSVIAGIQVVLGFLNLAILENYTNGFVFLGIAALNFFAAYRNYQYSNRILTAPIGVVENYQPLTSHIITLIYNLVFGGVIGVAGSIYDLTVRSYVMTNASAFLSIEQQFKNKEN